MAGILAYKSVLNLIELMLRNKVCSFHLKKKKLGVFLKHIHTKRFLAKQGQPVNTEVPVMIGLLLLSMI